MSEGGRSSLINFDDNFLARVLTKAARRLNQRLGLSITNRPQGVPGNWGGRRLQVSPITLDLEAGTISPNNDELCDLIILQMEHILNTSETSARKRTNNCIERNLSHLTNNLRLMSK